VLGRGGTQADLDRKLRTVRTAAAQLQAQRPWVAARVPQRSSHGACRARGAGAWEAGSQRTRRRVRRGCSRIVLRLDGWPS
jgi:hypothetical protein